MNHAPTDGVTIGLTAPYGDGRAPSQLTTPRPPADGDLAVVAVASRDAERVVRHVIGRTGSVTVVDATPESLDDSLAVDAARETRETHETRVTSVDELATVADERATVDERTATDERATVDERTAADELAAIPPAVDRWLGNRTGRPVVWVPSVAALFDETRGGHAQEIVETLVDRVPAADARLHLTVDQTTLDATTVGTLLSLADSVVEPTPNGFRRASAD